MKAWRSIGVVVLTVAAACFLWLKWKQDEPRRHSFNAVQSFAAALNSGDTAALLQTVVLPASASGRTSAEQTEFLTKAAFILGPKEGQKMVRQFGAAAVWVTNDGRVHATEGLEKQLEVWPPSGLDGGAP